MNSSVFPPPLVRTLRFAVPLLILGIFTLAIWTLSRELKQFHWLEMRDSIQRTAPGKLALAGLFTIASFASIVGFRAQSFRYAGRPQPWEKTSLISLIVSWFALNLGAAIITSNLARGRLLSREGFSMGEMARSAVADGTFSILGQLLLSGFVLTWHAVALPQTTPEYLSYSRLLGFLLLLAGIAGTAAILVRIQPLHFRNWQLPMPGRRLFLTGMTAGVLDWLFAGLVVVVLLPDSGLPAGQVLAIVLLAQLAASVSHVPGGLGVFEVAIIALMPEAVSRPQIMGSLLVFRAVYLVAPFAIALFFFVWMELSSRAPSAPHPLLPVWEKWRQFAPAFMAVLVFLAGGMLLVSGNTPSVPERIRWLRNAVPLGLVEMSHFLASIAGILLIVLAWSLRRRVNAAWWVTVILLGLAMVLSLTKGLDYEETIFLGLVLISVIPLRDQFYRQADLFVHRFSVRWWVLCLCAVTLATWIGFLAYQHIDYQDQLWWRFTFTGDAPRFLRASAGIAVVLLGIALLQLLRPSAGKDQRQPGLPDDTVRAILESSPDAETGLAWLGDKRFMVSADKRAALMYGTWGRSRVVLGDPFGPPDAWEGLLWTLLDECDRAGQRPVIYGLSEENAHHYLDVGLQLFKVGEEARVPLNGFSLQGSNRKDLRNTVSKLNRQGCSFDLIPKGGLAPYLATLREISGAWLAGKNAQEKCFSLGFFQEEFLSHFPIAILRKEGEIVAFANVLHSGSGKEEFSIDLMRFHPEKAPNGTMQYLFTKLMLWGHEEGYQWFSLGIAPLSGLDNRTLAPLWHKVGGTIFRHAEHFYNFQGLRAYKDKFDPIWISAYVAVPNGLDMPAAMLDSSALVSGGIVGMIKK